MELPLSHILLTGSFSNYIAASSNPCLHRSYTSTYVNRRKLCLNQVSQHHFRRFGEDTLVL